MRISEVIRDSEGPEDGQFTSKVRKGETGTETEVVVHLTPVEKSALQSIDSLGKAATVDEANAQFCGLVQTLTEHRGQIVGRLTMDQIRKPGG